MLGSVVQFTMRSRGSAMSVETALMQIFSEGLSDTNYRIFDERLGEALVAMSSIMPHRKSGIGFPVLIEHAVDVKRDWDAGDLMRALTRAGLIDVRIAQRASGAMRCIYARSWVPLSFDTLTQQCALLTRLVQDHGKGHALYLGLEIDDHDVERPFREQDDNAWEMNARDPLVWDLPERIERA